MNFGENYQLKETRSASKIAIYSPFHLILTFFDSTYPPPLDYRFYAQQSCNHRMSNTQQFHTHRLSTQPYINSRHAVAKMISMLLGVQVSIYSYFAYSDSIWYSEGYWLQCQVAKAENISHMIWTWPPNSLSGILYKMETKVCPSIAHERFLVCSSALLLLVSFFSFIACCCADIETVSAVRKRDAFYNLFSGALLMIGGILFMVSPARLQNGNKCWSKDKTQTGFVQSSGCGEVFVHDGKYIAGALGIIDGLLYIILACILENTKLYGMDSRRPLRHSGDADELHPPQRQSLMRTKKRSSLTANNKGMKKGVGSFGAVTSNIVNKGTHTKRGGSNEVMKVNEAGVNMSASLASANKPS